MRWGSQGTAVLTSTPDHLRILWAHLPTGVSFLRKQANPSSRDQAKDKFFTESQGRKWRGRGQQATGVRVQTLGCRRGLEPPPLEKSSMVTGKRKNQGNWTHRRDLELLQSTKPLGRSRGSPWKPRVLGGITQQMTFWTWDWTSTRGHSTFMKGPGRHRPQTTTHRKQQSSREGSRRNRVDTEKHFPPQSVPRRDIPL